MKHKTFIIIFAAVFLICIMAIVLIANNSNGNVASITVNGEIIYEIDLSNVKTPYEIPIENDGKTNVVLVEKGSISMLEASCPDKLCIKQGSISHSGYPIVCLPNNVIIEVK